MSTDWDAHYRSGDLPWDKGAAAPPLLEWLDNPAHRLTGEVLVPGCGLGHDVRVVAADRAARVCGLDFAPAAVAQAEKLPRVGGERYVVGDLFDLPPPLRGRFDWVFEHTCFCAIDPARRPDYVRAVARALRPGGELLAVFYLEPWARGEPPPPEGGPPFPVGRAELAALFGEGFEVVEEYTPTRAYRGREGKELVQRLRCGEGPRSAPA